MIREIRLLGDPVLQAESEIVSIERAKANVYSVLIEDMLETMQSHKAVGLAASQVGESVQIVVIDTRNASQERSEMIIGDVPQDVAQNMPMVLLDPVITYAEGKTLSREGCLSLPGVMINVTRSKLITVGYTKPTGETAEFTCMGFLANVVQHELDHLKGILMYNRADAATKASISGSLKKIMKYRKFQDTVKKLESAKNNEPTPSL